MSLYSNQQLTDAAAEAESLQPKGTTLSTQQVGEVWVGEMSV